MKMKRVALSCEKLNKFMQWRFIRNALGYTTTLQITTSAAQPNAIRQYHEGVSSLRGLFNQLGKKQNFVTTAILHGACWNCGKVTMRKELMFCADCGHLQDVDNNINYFDVLSLPSEFNLESTALTKRFRQLQSIVHPDKFSRKSERERAYSAAWSSYINAAYKTLLTPLERAQYLLHLRGQAIQEENTSLDNVFLMDMMERNEEVEEATTEENLKKIHETIQKDQEEKLSQLSMLFQTNDLESAKLVLMQMKYLKRIENAIKTKLQNIIMKL